MPKPDKILKPTRGGVRLDAWLTKTNMTQKQLADKLGTVQQNVSEWIRGDRPAPLKHALAIQKLTKIKAEDWTVEVEPDSSTSVEPIAKAG